MKDKIGLILTRIVVPLWILSGAAFKLYERNEGNLPGGIREIAQNLDIDLAFLLRLLIGLEFLAVGVMFCLPRFARAMAIFMLSCFCLILLNEIRRKATGCGCFGSLPVQPWQMLIVDGALLLGVLFCKPNRAADHHPPHGAENRPVQNASLTSSIIAMIVMAAVGLGISFIVPQPAATEQRIVQQVPPITTTQPADTTSIQPQSQPIVIAPTDPTINPKPLAIPSSWYVKPPGTEAWIGKPWRELELLQLMSRWPKGLDTGKHYIVFYSRTCEHCEAMFRDHLLIELDAPITAVQIPVSKTEMTPPESWTMLPTPAALLELPLGCNYIVTPPISLTIIDGVVTCAVEGEGYEKCLGVTPMQH